MSSIAATVVAARPTIEQDGEQVGIDVLRDRAADLSLRLRQTGFTRVAVCSPRADIVATALLASEQADVEIMLLRRQVDAATLRAWNVQASIGEDLKLADSGSEGLDGRAFAVLLTTSGTTGTPKVAHHDPDRLLGRIRRPTRRDALPTWLLTYHPASFAGLQVLLSALVSGGPLVSCRTPSVTELARAARRHQVSHISATPTFWRAFLMALGPDASALPLAQATLGGEAADQAILDWIGNTFPGAAITHIYASTEAGALFAVQDRQAGFPAAWLSDAVDGVELRIVDGLLEVKSPRAMNRYLANTGSDSVLAGGWLRTNDRVAVKEGRVLFLGRHDSILNVGGANVSPEEVEAVLLRAPGVADVRVSGARNPLSGHVVQADVVVKPGHDPAEVRQALLTVARQALDSHQIPRIVRIVESFAYSETGKKPRL